MTTIAITKSGTSATAGRRLRWRITRVLPNHSQGGSFAGANRRGPAAWLVPKQERGRSTAQRLVSFAFTYRSRETRLREGDALSERPETASAVMTSPAREQ